MTTFEGGRLITILAEQQEAVDVRHPKGHVEVRYSRAIDAVRLVRNGGYFGVGHGKRIKYIQPYNEEARIEPWGVDLGVLATGRLRRPSTSAFRAKGCLGKHRADSTLHFQATDRKDVTGTVIRRI
jgi:hypothetical protein